MIYNKFINCQTLEIFNASLESGEIIDQHIVFIEDVKQIWTNGTFYAANEFDQADLDKLTKLADVLVMDGDGTKVLSNNGTYVTMPIFSEAESEALINLSKIIVTDGDGSKVLANNGTYVSMPDLNTTDVTSIKNLLSIIQTDGDGTKVLANDGTYIDANKVGTVTAGSETKHVYLKDGSVIGSSSTIGSETKPVYMSNGSITACNDTLDVNISGYVTRDRGSNTVSTLTSLPVDKGLIIATLADATDISLSSPMNVGESITIIATPSASFTQPLPDSEDGDWISMDGDSLNVTANKVFEFNIYCYAESKYSISCKTKK